MDIQIKTLEPMETPLWDEYVYNHPMSTIGHVSSWKKIIEKTYHHNTYYLAAFPVNSKNDHSQAEISKNRIVGILPLVHIKYPLCGNSLISVPFLDYGGILSENITIEKLLLAEAVKLGKKLGCPIIELRNVKPISWCSTDSSVKFPNNDLSEQYFRLQTLSYKVNMSLALSGNSKELMNSFKSKLRNQIKRPIKEGLYAKVGSFDLLDDFYAVFAINMKDLGSPVHSKNFIYHILKKFEGTAKIIMVYQKLHPVACGLVIGFRQTLVNPWASSLKKYKRTSPNMLLYWTMIEYAYNNNYLCFDFGRSSPGGGSYKFKEQWGANPITLHWQYVLLSDRPQKLTASNSSALLIASKLWKRLPLSITKIAGPVIRKHLGL